MTDNNYPYEVLDADKLEGGMIHRAMLAVIGDIPPVTKEGKLDLGGKSVPFTRVDDIRNAINPHLERHGIVSYIRCVRVETELQVASEPMTQAQINETTKLIEPAGREIRDGKIPTTRSWALAEYDMIFIFVGDNSSVTVSAVGHAYDTNSDKALAKATTAAIKRILSETFKITDQTEGDEEEKNPDAGNRPATTDRLRGEGQDRGGQAVAAAKESTVTASTRRAGGRPQATPAQVATSEEAVAETGADPDTGEVPEGAPTPSADPSRLDKAKARVRDAVKILGYDQAKVNAIATEETGNAERSDWIALPTAVEKLAKRLEADVKAKKNA